LFSPFPSIPLHLPPSAPDTVSISCERRAFPTIPFRFSFGRIRDAFPFLHVEFSVQDASHCPIEFSSERVMVYLLVIHLSHRIIPGFPHQDITLAFKTALHSLFASSSIIADQESQLSSFILFAALSSLAYGCVSSPLSIVLVMYVFSLPPGTSLSKI